MITEACEIDGSGFFQHGHLICGTRQLSVSAVCTGALVVMVVVH